MVYTFCQKTASDFPNIKKDDFRKKLEEMSRDTRSTIGKAIRILLGFLQQGKNNFFSTELQTLLGLDSIQTKGLCHKIKEKGLIILLGYENDKPKYTLAYAENQAAHAEPVKAGFIPKTQKKEYSQAVIDRLKELSESSRSPKDRRIGIMLTNALHKGKITEVDYINAGYTTHWKKDMKLAEQIGLIKRFNQGCCTILTDIKPGPSEMSNNQKEIATAMYQSFGDRVFSTEMVIATLDYTSSHVSAVLHQFTLMRILNCNNDTENKYTYQFMVNPRENPECFAKVA